MAELNPQIDTYIDRTADFAKPILNHIRKLVHKACPDVEEKMKWSFPHFDYKGSMMCSMAAFKAHCAFGFWKASIMPDPEGILNTAEEKAMGQMGRITSVKDLPADSVLLRYVREAMRLNDEGVTVPVRPASERKHVAPPKDLLTALRKNPAAKRTFDGFTPGHAREYVEWVEEAKTDATRQRRIATAVVWMAEGKTRNWKYGRK